tara:strand:- start:477 stop:1121 length:645 start_codon:yes stop_codon:yes gene_type:complete
MGYLDNTSVTVDAVLTKLGRERLSQGSLNITKFGLGDDEIDYGMYDTSHNLGTAYYGQAIEGLPILEAFTNDTQTLKHRLVTLDKNTQILPVVTVAQTSVTLTQPGQNVVISPSTSNVTGANSTGYVFTLSNSDIATIAVNEAAAGDLGGALQTADTTATGYQLATTINAMSISLTAYSITQTTTATLTITGIETGGSVTIPITVNQDPALTQS